MACFRPSSGVPLSNAVPCYGSPSSYGTFRFMHCQAATRRHRGDSCRDLNMSRRVPTDNIFSISRRRIAATWLAHVLMCVPCLLAFVYVWFRFVWFWSNLTRTTMAVSHSWNTWMLYVASDGRCAQPSDYVRSTAHSKTTFRIHIISCYGILNFCNLEPRTNHEGKPSES